MINLRELVEQLRTEILIDVDTDDFRWSDVLIVRAIRTTIADMVRIRPIILFTATNEYTDLDTLLAPVTGLTHEEAFTDELGVESTQTVDTVVDIPSKYKEAMLHGVAFRCFMSEAGVNMSDARVTVQQQLFASLMEQ